VPDFEALENTGLAEPTADPRGQVFRESETFSSDDKGLEPHGPAVSAPDGARGSPPFEDTQREGEDAPGVASAGTDVPTPASPDSSSVALEPEREHKLESPARTDDEDLRPPARARAGGPCDRRGARGRLQHRHRAPLLSDTERDANAETALWPALAAEAVEEAKRRPHFSTHSKATGGLRGKISGRLRARRYRGLMQARTAALTDGPGADGSPSSPRAVKLPVGISSAALPSADRDVGATRLSHSAPAS